MNCDYCIKPLTIENPGIMVVCPKYHEHKFHKGCIRKALKGCCFK